MNDALDAYTRISEGFDRRLRAVGEDQWTNATPCTDWDVRALVSHLVGTHHLVLGTLGKTYPTPGDGDDLVEPWTTARHDLMAALADPETASRVVQAPFGEMPFSVLAGGIMCGDTLFHTWDLARATGQDEDLGDDLCERQLGLLQPLDGAIRAPGFFGDKIAAPEGADVQTQLLCFGGRQP